MRSAVIDLGTNTFHLLVTEHQGSTTRVLYKDSTPTYIGRGGINQKTITPEAIERAVILLKKYKQVVDSLLVTEIKAIGTSAIRNADNGQEFCDIIYQKTGFTVTVISGEQEAELIYEGVKRALPLGQEPSLIIDIGGGSVEFIIGNEARIFWKQSFEIGGQRLLEKFMTTDPIPQPSVVRLQNYLQEQLLPLANAMHQYDPLTLVGASGTFDTLAEIDHIHRTQQPPEPSQTAFDLPLAEFYRTYQDVLFSNRSDRLNIPGMIALRVDMIVVAMVLIDYVLRSFNIKAIKCAAYALKEGVMWSNQSKN
jgi:exopolyphosphatase / guanosine-5'-triphosphate,3'-diphosphate pyrophosphatase